MEYSVDGRICNRCINDTAAHGFQFYMTNAGCKLNCSNVNEQNFNRWECECVAGYVRNTFGLCVKDCSVYYDSLLHTCADDVNSCCCPENYTYGVH